MVETWPVGCGLLVFGLFWLSLFFSPPSDCSSLPSFFPRERTPCGHGAQVIVKGREEQTDGDCSSLPSTMTWAGVRTRGKKTKHSWKRHTKANFLASR